MDAPGQMYYFQMLVLLFVMSFFTIWLGRMVQWFFLRKIYATRNIIYILIASFIASYLLSLLIWFCWPQPAQLLFGVLFLPTVLSEIFLLAVTFFAFKRNKN